jgi:hypothetical protein
MKKKVLLFLILLLAYFCFLGNVSAAPTRTLSTVWIEAVNAYNAGSSELKAVEDYYKNCSSRQISPTTYYPTKTIRHLKDGAQALRFAADRMEEQARMLEHPDLQPKERNVDFK